MADRMDSPRWIYASGDEPDPRFSFANERTFLAWIRTALALLAAGVALSAIDVPVSHQVRELVSHGLIVLGVLSPPIAWFRWARSERALRHGQPLPAFTMASTAAFSLTVLALAYLLMSL